MHLGTRLLPREARRGMQALYAVVRVSDDLSDLRGTGAEQSWARWRHVCVERPEASDPVSLAWAHAAHRHEVPRRYVEQFFDGLSRDLGELTIDTFEDFVEYCYGVACPVPLMAMHIVGGAPREAIPFAVRLGVALQLSNNLRDVGEDLASGRVYLPRQELAAYGITREQLVAGRVDDRWRAFMRMQIARAREIYRRAMPGIDLLPPTARFATGAVAELYLGVLDDIEAHDYDVFRRRAGVSNASKLRRLPGIWFRSRRRGYGALAQALAT